MRAEVATKFSDLLRSGEIAQGVHRLRGSCRMCVSGVLCELFRRETGQGKWSTDGIGGGHRFTLYGFEYYGATPNEVMIWAGISRATSSHMVFLNDSSRTSFEDFAKMAENGEL